MKWPLFIVLFWLTMLAACGSSSRDQKSEAAQTPVSWPQNPEQVDTVTLAGGCFWCVEAGFEQIDGVYEAVSGYAGGDMPDPTYQQVARGQTQHAESVQIYYNPKSIDYETLLNIFFTVHDPTQLNRQGPDVGRQYRSAIFYHNARQKEIAEKKIQDLDASGRFQKPIVTELQPLEQFYKAESYHQNYEEKNPNDPYIRRVSRPKIERVRERFKDLLKSEATE